MREINLLPQYERKSQNLFYYFLLFLIVILISYSLFGFYYFSTKSKVKAVDIKQAELNVDMEELDMELNQETADETLSIEQAVLFAENYNIPTSTLILELNDLLPEQSYLSDYTYSNKVSNIIVHFETLDAIANYTSDLTTTDFLEDAKVNGISTFELKEDADQDEDEYEDEEIVEDEIQFDIIPRYEADFTLDINKEKLKGEQDLDE